MSSGNLYETFPVNPRLKLSALWTSMIFVFAYVDLFSLYRADFRADIEVGEIAGFTIGQAFLFGTTVYIAIPSLMVAASLLLRPGLVRVLSLVLTPLYALTIVVGAVGEWTYYVAGSAVEVVLLAIIGVTAWRWPRAAEQGSTEPGSVATHHAAVPVASVGAS